MEGEGAELELGDELDVVEEEVAPRLRALEISAEEGEAASTAVAWCWNCCNRRAGLVEEIVVLSVETSVMRVRMEFSMFERRLSREEEEASCPWLMF